MTLDLGTWPLISLTYEGALLHLWPKFGCNRNYTFNFSKKLYKFYIFHLTWPQMTLDFGTWSLTSLTYKGTHIASLTQVCFQSDFNFSKETQITKIFPPYLTSDDLWPWYVTFDLINIWVNPYCIFHLSLVVIGHQLFKGDPKNENLT